MTQILSKRFELERSSLDDSVFRVLGKAERDIVQADQAILQIKAAVKANSNVSLLSTLNQTFHKSLNNTREMIVGIQTVLSSNSQLERSLVNFKQEQAGKIIRTINTDNV
jgi:DNA-binding GntR family transcriptional regulator